MSIGSVLQVQSGQSLTPDSPPEDLAGSSEVVRSTGGVGVHPLAQESKVLHCGEMRCVFTKWHTKTLCYTSLSRCLRW